MKRIVLLLLFAPFCAFSQIVNIPDANFKTKLLEANPSNQIAWGNGGYIKIDDNNDGEIQLSEAAVVDSLNVSSSNISGLAGIGAFSNLKKLQCVGNSLYTLNLSGLNLTYLNCSSNYLTSLDVSSMTNLDYLNCAENNILSLSLTALTNLEVLFVDSNELAALDVLNNILLKTLSVAGNNLTSLDLSGLASLEYISAYDNDLATINLTGLGQLKILNLRENQFTSLTISNFPNLEYFYCEENLIETLVVENLPSILELRAGRNPYTTLDVSTLSNIAVVDVEGAALISLDVSGLANLNVIYAYSNFPGTGQLASLILDGCESLQAIYIEGNQLTTIDASSCHNLTYIDASNNNLETLFVKNGSVEDVYVAGNPNLTFICADDFQIPQIQNWLEMYQMTNVAVHSYCSFNPGNPYNTISGVVRFDENGDGCGDLDLDLSNVKIVVSDGTINGAAFTNVDGIYAVFAQQPDMTLAASMENPAYFNVSPAVTVHFDDNNYNTATANFCVSPNGVHPDVEIVIVPIGQARPGFDAIYALTFKNKGNQTMAGNLALQFQNSVLDFVSSSVAPDLQSGNLLSWNYSNLLPFETRTIELVLNVNSPMETPAVNIGDELNFSATVNPVSADETSADNVFGLKQIVVGSFDPNDKICIEGSVAPPSQIGDYLHYVINFENTGTFAAEKVVIKDLIDTTKFDITSLQILSASHAEIPVITGNTVEFYFQDIDLQPNQYGYVAFKIKTRPTLTVGSTVTNKANIYFDFNFPIETNVASTTFQELGLGETDFDASVRVFPNPATTNVEVRSSSPIKSVVIYDMQGRKFSRRNFDSENIAIDISNLQSGVYFLTIATDRGIKTERIVKE